MVIGLGRMGAALAATLLKNEYEVAVWNRTSAKAAPLREAGAIQADSVAEGIRASDVIVICVGNYDDAKSVLEDCGDLAGKTLVHLTTAVAPETRSMEAWAIQKGALYLDGAILSFPRDVGTDECCLLMAGSQDAWRVGEPIVRCLGGSSEYMGDNVAGPTAFDAALIVSSLSVTLGMIQGAQIIEKEGLDVGVFVDMLAREITANTGGELRRQGNAIARNEFGDTEAALETWAVALSKVINENAERGLNVELPQAISSLLNRAVKAGYGEEEIAAGTDTPGTPTYCHSRRCPGLPINPWRSSGRSP
jgi:3-hydroxyisobutyrate dehydrogenase-like beta-hydroxyacid dehydrogenase